MGIGRDKEKGEEMGVVEEEEEDRESWKVVLVLMCGVGAMCMVVLGCVWLREKMVHLGRKRRPSKSGMGSETRTETTNATTETTHTTLTKGSNKPSTLGSRPTSHESSPTPDIAVTQRQSSDLFQTIHIPQASKRRTSDSFLSPVLVTPAIRSRNDTASKSTNLSLISTSHSPPESDS